MTESKRVLVIGATGYLGRFVTRELKQQGYFLKKGRDEFDQPISKVILVLLLLVSIAQLSVTLFIMHEVM
ncbi:MAG: hypothetical protein JRH06_04460 [Deltaproteobacteria bacterium]|nr:hypothetical protein [Deltaproteobacteria bacterium]MBW2136792.1 hypothetical protein [Deltaproteobacteria bacterium]